MREGGACTIFYANLVANLVPNLVDQSCRTALARDAVKSTDRGLIDKRETLPRSSTECTPILARFARN